LFRFAQEGLANASRHAEGRDLEVELRCSAEEVRLAVRDRGPGLPERPADRGGLGLGGLRDRVESLGGTFVARTRPEEAPRSP
jgi:signal transduction histidine kinase